MSSSDPTRANPASDDQTRDACPVVHAESSAGPKHPKSSLFSMFKSSASTAAIDEANPNAPAVVVRVSLPPDNHADIHFTPKTSSSELKRQIIAKLKLPSTSSEFYFKDPDGHLVLDVTPTALALFPSLELVVGQPAITPTPGPRGLPVFGNAHQLVPDPYDTFKRFNIKYGDTYRISIFDQRFTVTLDPDVIQRMSFESTFFTKKIVGVLKEVQEFGGHGLFTSDTSDPEWGRAHKILLPPFSAASLKMYLDDMNHTASQLVSILDKMNGQSVPITEFMTRFALQTIGKCGFSYDFQLLDGPDAPLHPFVDAMSYCLTESNNRWVNVALYKKLPIKANAKFEGGNKLMRETVEKVIAERRANPHVTKSDLLHYMLTAKTPDGETLSEVNIRDQVITFLIAGHETTATLLSWNLWLLTQHPAVANRVLEEVVRVCGPDPSVPITAQQLAQLPYVTQVLKETLRLFPPAPGYFKYCNVSTTVGSGHRINAGEPIIIEVVGLHRSRKLWGPNPEVFDPNNFSKEEEAKRHPFAWIPFSIGERSCIGLGFALQEAKIAVATLVRKFTFEYQGPVPAPYDPEGLTLKPKDLSMIVHKRDEMPSMETIAARAGMLTIASPTGQSPATPQPSSAMNLIKRPSQVHGEMKLKTMTIAFGSNMGTAEGFAQQIASTARRFGVKDVAVLALDEWVQGDGVTRDGPDAITVVVTSTYNGNAPDNASKASEWFKSHIAAGKQLLPGLQFAVFGCGNSQWRTFQKFPRLVDSALDTLGGNRVVDLGQCDADAGDVDGEFTQWHARLWVILQERFDMAVPEEGNAHPMVDESGVPEAVRVEVLPAKGNAVAPVRPTTHVPTNVTINRELLTAVENLPWTQGKSTRHLELATNQSYLPGDHLEIWPENDPDLVAKLAAHLQVDLDSGFRLEIPETVAINPKCSAAVLSAQLAGAPCTVRDALTYYVDLVGPMSRTLAEVVAERQGKADVAKSICQLDASAMQTMTAQYTRAIDAMLAAPQLDLKTVLLTAAAIIPRRYSIASSAPGSVKLCVGVQEKGLCSSFLGRVPAGHTVYTLVKACPHFRLPADPSVPVVMVCAGTGLAPFLGFVEARLSPSPGVKNQAKAHLFFGCRHPDHDHLYKSEMDAWVTEGALTKTHVAYSRAEQAAAASGDVVKYVQHVVAQQAELMVDLIHHGGACLYVCGSARGMGHDLGIALEKVFADKLGVNGSEYCAELRASKRYLEDVWG